MFNCGINRAKGKATLNPISGHIDVLAGALSFRRNASVARELTGLELPALNHIICSSSLGIAASSQFIGMELLDLPIAIVPPLR